METVRIKKHELITKLEENLKKHDDLYEKALDNYWTKIKEEFAKKVEKTNKIIDAKDITNGGVNIQINISAPQNNSDDYVSALSMLEYEVDHVVELTQQEFKSYVLNQWYWTDSFLTSNAMYVSSQDVNAFSGNI